MEYNVNEFSVTHPNKLVKIGFITAIDANSSKLNELLESRLADCLEQRKTGTLTEKEEQTRSASRDMLRFGTYKPTGRSKPASEYLLRTAQEGQFPRINTLVDINNYISMKYVLPISLWDLQKAGTNKYVFRPGNLGEEYVFNPTGQIISVLDLMAGFALIDGKEVPIVNPVKDSMMTKTDAQTTQIGVAIYFPTALSEQILTEALTEFKELLELGGAGVLESRIVC
jgi:DNA/RNA-binding domain of Phe-tRNA-synthetase-like protein